MPKVSTITSDDVNISDQTKDYENVTDITEKVSDDITEIQSSDSFSELTVSYPLNLNTCTAQELISLDGIGEKKANDIIEYREYLGGYTSVEQIKNIKGIGDSVYEKVSPYLTV